MKKGRYLRNEGYFESGGGGEFAGVHDDSLVTVRHWTRAINVQDKVFLRRA